MCSKAENSVQLFIPANGKALPDNHRQGHGEYKMKKPIIALIYDFDHTLCDQDMQNYTFIPNLDMTPEEFWDDLGDFTRQENMEGILSYLYYMVKKSKEKGLPITKKYLKEMGKDIKFFPMSFKYFLVIGSPFSLLFLTM